ncbi:MAG TPA: class I SAM-dependent rRNA methyltransferase [Aliidongia sp.]|nr:class I SAM-dependent rRNA methyltransferase [Aliidongia sp.]
MTSDPVPDDLATRPTITLAPRKEKRAEQGHPWIYSNEIVLDERAKALPPGTLVTVLTGAGRRLGVASFNFHPLVSLRLFDRDPGRRIDAGFFAGRLKRALEIRTRLFDEPYYRLVHAEADGLPGLIIDRYGPALVCQLNTAGMALLEPELLKALDQVLKPEIVMLRNDSAARAMEGLETETRLVKGSLDGPFTVRENGMEFLADLAGGQKTGWFFDQRPNRAVTAALAKDMRVLDAYAYTGGFGVLAAGRGAAEVTLLDRSEPALALAVEAARRNGVADRVKTLQGDAFETLDRLVSAKERFDLVLLDPPAFVKSKKELGPGSRGYRKLARLGSALVGRGGFMMIASCSHNMALDPFVEAVRQGIQDAGRTARLIHTGFAGPDHPTLPALPESSYLKALVLAVD